MSAVAPLRVLHITDTHLLAEPGARLLGVDTAETLAAVLGQAMSQRIPDVILATGDLAHEPSPPTYARFRQIVDDAFRGPVLHLPGNHDLLAPMAPLLCEPPSLAVGSWEILGFDTHVDHRTEAALGVRGRRALEARIRGSSARFLLLACHHPPVAVGCPWLDKDCIPEGHELLESCAAHPRVRGLVFGHVHQQVETAHGPVAVLGTPSTCFQFEPGSRSFAIDRSARTGVPGYRWLELHPDGALTSETHRLTGFELSIDLSDRS